MSFAIAMTLVGLALFAIYVFVTTLLPRIPEINASVGAAIVAGFAAVSVGLATKYYEQKMNIRKELREKKVPVYEQLLAFIFRVVMSDKTGEIFPENEMIKEFNEITQKLIIWGSDELVGVFEEFRTSSRKTPENTVHLVRLTGLVMLAVRKDLGHDNKGITHRRILSLFINDIERIEV